MSLRASMLPLIQRTRTLIGDQSGSAFADTDIQDALDRRRAEHRFVSLRGVPSFPSGGQAQYLDFYSTCEQWEEDILLQDVGYNVVTADLYENLVGHWHFNVQPNGMAIRATGKTYDIYGSAADLLESWAAQVKLDFDFQSDKDRYSRSQKSAMLMSLADSYRKKALPVTSRAIQSDARPAIDGGGIVYPSVGPGGYGN